MSRSAAPPSPTTTAQPGAVPPTGGAAPGGNVVPLRGVGSSDPTGGPAYEAPIVALNVLGEFELLVDGELVDVGSSGQRLLTVVACRGRQATRGQVARVLWPDVTDDRALANLRTALYRLVRRAPLAVHAINQHLQLPVGMQIDLERTTRLAKRILGADVLADEWLLDDLLSEDFADDLLPDWDEEWLTDHQYRYRQLRLTTLETLSGHFVTTGHFGAAVQAALLAVQADSLRDSAHETLIRAYLAQGNRRDAFAHFGTYRRLLREELGIDPPVEIGRLLTSA